MLLPVGAITQLVSEGYATLQVAFLDTVSYNPPQVTGLEPE